MPRIAVHPQRLEKKYGKPLDQILEETLAAQPSGVKAAKKLGVGYNTLRRWLAIYGFYFARNRWHRDNSRQ